MAHFDVRDAATLCLRLRDERTQRGHRNSVETDPKPTSLFDRHVSLLTLNSARNHARAGVSYGRSAC